MVGFLWKPTIFVSLRGGRNFLRPTRQSLSRRHGIPWRSLEKQREAVCVLHARHHLVLLVSCSRISLWDSMPQTLRKLWLRNLWINRLRLGSGSFAPSLRFEKWEIHTVFLHFPNLAWEQNLSLPALADLFRASQNKTTNFVSSGWQSEKAFVQ